MSVNNVCSTTGSFTTPPDKNGNTCECYTNDNNEIIGCICKQNKPKGSTITPVMINGELTYLYTC